MALLEVLRFPDERLRNVAHKIESVDDSIRSLIDDMFETMEQEQGIGLCTLRSICKSGYSLPMSPQSKTNP